jgi:quercetin dioxygenase-like cupin family protein
MISIVAAVASELAMLPQTDLGIKHHFSDGVYAKQMHLPKGHQAVSHRHAYSHLSVLASGVAIVKTDDTEITYTAPACIEIAAGVKHAITALEDVTWFCIHATNETDIKKIDQVLIKED